jgi:GDP-D-mannose dehydratase
MRLLQQPLIGLFIIWLRKRIQTLTITTGTTYQIKRYTNVGLTGTVVKTTLTNTLLTSQPTAFSVSKYTSGTTTLLVGTRTGKLYKLTNANTTPTWTDLSSSAFVGTISDIEYGAADPRKAESILGWKAKYDVDDVIQMMSTATQDVE